MPIRREHRGFYPIDWPQLSAVIRFRRAGGRCESCGRLHGEPVWHLGDGRWWDPQAASWRDGAGRVVCLAVQVDDVLGSVRTTRVILAIGHRNHDTVDGSAVTSAGVGMNTDRRSYSASVSPKIFRDACGAILAAAAPDMPVARVQKDAATATDLFAKKRKQDVREGRLIIYGERHEPSFKSRPDDA